MIHVSIMYVNMTVLMMKVLMVLMAIVGTTAIVSMRTEAACILKTWLVVIAVMVPMMGAVFSSKACQKPQI
jgi:hypothetical protein